MKKLLVTLFLSLLAACSSGSDSTPPTSDPITPTINTVASSSLIAYDQAGAYNINLTGSGNTVTIAKDNMIESFNLVGSNNLITVLSNTSVDGMKITGDDNTVIVPINSGITFTTAGSGNQLMEE